MIIKPLLTSAVETALNHYLSLDEDVSLFLAPISGKVIAINILQFNETMYLCPTQDKIQILESYTQEVDATISGSLSALGLMSLSSTPMKSIFSGEVTIEGDTHVAHKFQQIFEKLDIDLEEKLSHFTGDIIAHKIGNFFRSGQDWTEESVTTFKLNSKEFLQEETRDLPAAPEADIFYHQVDKLRSDFDRLLARLEKIQTEKPSTTKTN
ncbi:MAG: SCP2 sterol-binding domain-containing protein [Methylococcales bacterium]|nr:SCP2 sterol-binding domain-containing protein [Methylococcales bacterium]